MKKITFVCLGNICRSPAAEYIFKKIIKDLGREDEFQVISRATSYEESGNDIYPPMKRMLTSLGIPFSKHRATRFTKEDYDNSDYIFYMENSNLYNLNRICEDKENKYLPIYKWTSEVDHIEDPWYSDRFDKVCRELEKCILDVMNNI